MTEQGNNGFEPEITVFTCIYCAYMAIDTAGALRIKYPANIKLIKLPCTGKTDTRYLLEAFEQGADGGVYRGLPNRQLSPRERERARANAGKIYQEIIGRDWLGRRAVRDVLCLWRDGRDVRQRSARDDGAAAGVGAKPAQE